MNQIDPFIILKHYRPENPYHQILSNHRKQSKVFINFIQLFFWTREQHRAYVELLQRHTDLVTDPEKRKELTVYSLFARLMGTRSSKQVKTHHQKMLKKYKNVENIIKATQNNEHAFRKRMEDSSIQSEWPFNERVDRMRQSFASGKTFDPRANSELSFSYQEAGHNISFDPFESYRCQIDYGDEIFDLI